MNINIPKSFQLFILSTVCLVLGGVFIGMSLFNTMFAYFGYAGIVAGYVMGFLTLRRVSKGARITKPEAPPRHAEKREFWE